MSFQTPEWRPFSLSDTGTNDSDKTLTLKAKTYSIIHSIRVELITTATVGNRQLEILILDDSGDVVDEARAGAVQAASLTYAYSFGPNAVDLTTVRDTLFLSVRTNYWQLRSEYQVRVYDNNAVDAAADDMVVHILGIEQRTLL